MAIILLGPMSPAVVLASTVVSTAMVPAQDVFEKAHFVGSVAETFVIFALLTLF